MKATFPVLAFFLPLLCIAQQVTVHGLVIDVNTRKPIPDVSISIKGTTLGTTSSSIGRFTLIVENQSDSAVVLVQHVAYERKEIPWLAFRTTAEIALQPRIIPMQATEIEGRRTVGMEAARDIPSSVSVLDAGQVVMRGYADAGELLRVDHSVQIDERFSGQKLMSIRGGNTDEVLILYNGVRLNSTFDNVFDLSLLDLSDIERVELIKGSNTTLFGSEAFSGVVNVIPRVERDYTARFHQQFGTYDSGIWGLQLHRGFGRMKASYTVRSGGMKRTFIDAPEAPLTNTSVHHTAYVVHPFEAKRDAAAPTLSALARLSTNRSENPRDMEQLQSENFSGTLTLQGPLGWFEDAHLSAAISSLSDDQTLAASNSSLHRIIDEETFQGHAQNAWQADDFEFVASYRVGISSLDFSDVRTNVFQQRIGLESATLTRTHHGFALLGTLHGETGSSFLHTFDINLGVRHDIASDRQRDVQLRSDDSNAGFFSPATWSETSFKFAIEIIGLSEDMLLKAFLSYGDNVKFPTLLQQISQPLALQLTTPSRTTLGPEFNNSVEVNASLTGILVQSAIDGWTLSGSFFQNTYDDKIRMLSTPGVPVLFYDVVPTAQISGFEFKATAYFFRKKVAVDVGMSRYFISEQSAFPFKSDSKRTISLSIDHNGYALHLLAFSEGEQIGLVRLQSGAFVESRLPEFNDMDLYFAKSFPIGKFKLHIGTSLRNILTDDKTELSGLTLRDRRYTLTFGAEY